MAAVGLAARLISTGCAPTSFTAAEWEELTIAMTPGAPGLRSPRVRRALDRLLAPLIDAGVALGFCNTIVCGVEHSMLHAMWTRGTAWGSWDAAAWQAVARAAGNRFSASVLGVAVYLGAITGAEALSTKRCEPTKLARRLFGADAVDREVNRVRLYLTTIGYGRHSGDRNSLLAAISRLLVQAGRAELEAITLEALDRPHAASPAGSEPSIAYYRLAHALNGMGLLPRGLKRRQYPKAPLTDVDPIWVEWCERWRRTTTLAREPPKARITGC